MNKQTNWQGVRLNKKLWPAVMLSAFAVVTGCGGGGGGTTNVPPAGTTTASVFSGPISGFGSVIVNGVRFDDSASTVTIDDNGGLANQLKLGMFVEIEAQAGTTATAGKASSITASSQIRGPISAKTADTVTVLGVTIALKASTIFDNVTGIAGLQVNDFIEVYGLADGPDGLTATRVEKTGSTEVRTVGTVQNLNTVAKTFTLHGVTVNYQGTSANNLDVALANGAAVRVKGSLAGGVVIAERIKAAKVRPDVKEAQHAELEGVITNFVSVANFQIMGLTIDASKVSPSVSLANGVRVEVEGAVTNGVLVATKVELKNERVEAEVELHATIENFNASAQTFALRSGSVPVHWSSATVFIAPLTAAVLANNVKVEVKGNLVNGVVEATRIKTDD